MISSSNVANNCLLSDHRYSERVGSDAIFTLAWQFLTDNSSPDIPVDMVASTIASAENDAIKIATRRVRGRGNMLAQACEN